jgi:hypothetical protein
MPCLAHVSPVQAHAQYQPMHRSYPAQLMRILPMPLTAHIQRSPNPAQLIPAQPIYSPPHAHNMASLAHTLFGHCTCPNQHMPGPFHAYFSPCPAHKIPSAAHAQQNPCASAPIPISTHAQPSRAHAQPSSCPEHAKPMHSPCSTQNVPIPCQARALPMPSTAHDLPSP